MRGMDSIWTLRSAVVPFLLLEWGGAILFVRWWPRGGSVRVLGMAIALVAAMLLAYAYASINAGISKLFGVVDDNIVFAGVLINNIALLAWLLSRAHRLRREAP